MFNKRKLYNYITSVFRLGNDFLFFDSAAVPLRVSGLQANIRHVLQKFVASCS